MRTNAIICEYNPFHNGHKYQIENIKKHSDNAITAIMSGSFTQRGDIAIIDKFKRAEVAIKNGVDLVVELPTVYACSSANCFAKAGVRIAGAIGCTDELCFSVEDYNPELLIEVAEKFEEEDFNEEIKLNMQNGDYYPQAVEKAFKKLYSNELSDIVTKPNNILAIEYLKALKGTDIKPYIIERVGIGHDSSECTENMASASNIRKMILKGEKTESFIPKPTPDFSYPADIKRLEKIILYKLRTMTANDFAELSDVSEGLENRILNSVRNSNSVEEIIDDIKTKRYTHARIRRIIIGALLNIKADMPKRNVPYLRVLAFNEKGEKLLSEIKKSGNLPLITNVSDGYKSLDENAREIFDIDLLASDIYSLATDKISKCREDFTKAIIKL
ncbi:MAG: nucleotidyltransferase [Ruminococcus sp.]|nr:nucleotidyltransferase [Ruminococcus sp.]